MTILKTTHFSVLYENGAVRWIKSHGVEVLRMIYSAVRDHNWGTIEPEIIDEIIEENETGFKVETSVKYRKADIHFEADFKITGYGNQLIFEMKGEARSTFITNRVGFCLLHPINECVGKSCLVFHSDGTSESVFFPELISPVQPIKNISGLEWRPGKNIQAKLQFSGDIFEMEDQRNWTDASYKTYCRPLALPFPFELKQGEQIQQKIVLEIQGETQTEVDEECILFKIDKNKHFKIPEIGVAATSRKERIKPSETEVLKQLPVQHLRVELKLFEKNLNRKFDRAAEESGLLELPLFLVLYFSEDFKHDLNTLQNTFQNKGFKVKYVLVVGKKHLPDDLIFDVAFPELKDMFPDAKIGAGVNANFAELNRTRPQSEKAEFISFAVCPQVHAFDNISLVENLEAQKYVVESARQLFPGRPNFISPVTLKQRFNVVATSEEPEAPPVELPSQVDVRQNSVFAAQWLLGSLKFLAQSGAGLVTFFETVGWRGFIQGNFNPPVPEKFSARKGDIFPVFYLLKELAGFDEVVHTESSAPLELDGIVLSNKNNRLTSQVFLANFSNDEKRIKLIDYGEIINIQSLFSTETITMTKNAIVVPGGSIVRAEVQ